jgi:hypothetical protein
MFAQQTLDNLPHLIPEKNLVNSVQKLLPVLVVPAT